jgi:hypothetical protein
MQQAASDGPIPRGASATKAACAVFAVALAAAFLVPVDGVSGLQAVKGLQGLGRINEALIPAAAALLLLFGIGPFPARLRGTVANLVGLMGIGLAFVAATQAGGFAWQALVTPIGYLLMTAGALLAVRAPDSGIGKYLATAGFVLAILPLAIPQNGSVPLAAIFQGFGSAPKAAIAGLLPLIVGLLAVVGPIAAPGAGEVLGWVVPISIVLGGILAAPSGAFLGTLLESFVPMAYVGAGGFGLAQILAQNA